MSTGYKYLEEHIGESTRHTLKEALVEEAIKVGHSIKIDADFDRVTESEQERLEQQAFPESLKLNSVNLTNSKRAFLNLTKGLDDDDTSLFEELWKFQPHNPHSYQSPIGNIDLTFADALPTKEGQNISHPKNT